MAWVSWWRDPFGVDSALAERRGEHAEVAFPPCGHPRAYVTGSCLIGECVCQDCGKSLSVPEWLTATFKRMTDMCERLEAAERRAREASHDDTT